MAKYIDSLKNGPAKLEDSLIPFKVTQTQKQCEIEISKAEEKIAEYTIALERAKAEHPLNLAAVVEATNKLGMHQKNLETARAIMKELF